MQMAAYIGEPDTDTTPATIPVVAVPFDPELQPQEGYTQLGTFDIEDEPSEEDNLGAGTSAVLFHHIRDLLYPLGIFDMQRVRIISPTEERPKPLV